MTERLYYIDPSLAVFDAVVTRTFDHEGRDAVTLDRTVFYPTSGGQPFDTGRLGPSSVVETLDVNGDVVHIMSSPLAEGTAVRGQIDWARRFDHMQQHTGQHVLSAAFDRLFGNPTVSFHMGTEACSIDLARDASSQEIERASDEANRVIWESRPVSIRFVSPDEAARLPLRKEPAREGRLRLIEIADFDLSACGGTHVASTGSIGMIGILGAERFRGGMRVSFVCGGRALQALRTYRDAVTGSVRALSVLPRELPGAIEKLQADAKELRKTISRQQESLAVHEGARLLGAAGSSAGVKVVVESLDGWDATGLKAVAAAMAADGNAAVALFSAASPATAVIARSSGVPIDAAAVLKQLMQRFGGRGGGKPDLAQGGGLSGDVAEMTTAARELLWRT